MVIAYHLGGLLGAWVGIAGSVGIMAQSEKGGISGFLFYFRVFIALTHEWTDFVRLLVAVFDDPTSNGEHILCQTLRYAGLLVVQVKGETTNACTMPSDSYGVTF